MATKQIVRWTIQIFDKTAENPLPLQNRHLLLDWTRVPSEELDLQKLLLAKRRESQQLPSPIGFDEQVITMSLSGSRGDDRQFLPYRQYFVEQTASEIQKEIEEPTAEGFRIENVSVHEYIEDQLGHPMTILDVMDHLSGGPALVLNNVDSVLRLGPVSIKSTAKWAQRDSDTIAQFLRVVEYIWRSKWAHSPVSLSLLSKPGEMHAIAQCLFPTADEFASVLAWLRQLYSSDDLFNHAANIYLRFVDHSGKFIWIRHVKDQFNRLRDSSPKFPDVPEYTGRELIDLAAYGGRVLHSKSDDDAEQKLSELMLKHGAEHVVLAINGAMRDVLSQATLAYHVFRQDFCHWVAQKLIPAPATVDLRSIMASKKNERAT